MADLFGRLPLALHLTQDQLPPSGLNANADSRSTGVTPGSGSGYGPPLSTEGTPLSKLVSSILYNPSYSKNVHNGPTNHYPTPSEASTSGGGGGVGAPSQLSSQYTPTNGNHSTPSGNGGGRTEYDIVSIPLTNGNWQERWERMCTITTSQTELDLGLIAGHGNSNLKGTGMGKGGSRRSLLGLSSGQDDKTRLEAENWRNGGGFNRNEVNLTRSEEAGNLIAFASDWLELDSPVEGIRFDSELALRQEVTYASYLSLTTIIVPPPRSENKEYLTDYARAINSALQASWHMNISIKLPTALFEANGQTSRPSTPGPGLGIVGNGAGAGAAAESDHCETWQMWDTIRSLCGYSPRLSLCLDLSSPLPPSHSLARWSAEPLRQVFLPCSTFISNAKGYPVLSKNMQAFLKSIFKFTPTVILSGANRSLHSAGGPSAYVQYIRYIYRKGITEKGMDPVEQYAQGYMDHLQAPLQPLMDNLEGETYEGFEKDPIKYRQYEEAVYQALMDRDEKRPTTIFVVGAGRGPLVAGCLRAAERSRRRISLTAVEKNPSAFVVLQERAALEWGNAVELVFSDMRSFMPIEKADIIVSELLGSFGDNELSPECLDGVMRCLKPEGISIPSSYTSYLAPITASKLHADVTSPVSSVPGVSSSLPDAKPAEQPYVVMFSAAHILSATGGRSGFELERVQECWTFDHPRPDVVVGPDGLPYTNHHNARSAHVTFHIPRAGVCHGFAGYFEAVLYGDIGLSIHPERAAGDMLSWFPIFFPLMDPIYLPAQSELDVQVWRLTDGAKRKVWFEWAATAFLSIPLPSLTYPTGTAGPSPRTSIGSGSALTPTASSPWDSRKVGPAGHYSPMMDAFASANSPLISGGQGHCHDRDSGRMQGIMEEPDDGEQSYQNDRGDSQTRYRVKISSTKLHNPQGRTSWIGL